jgi:hypothetical protein
VKDSQTGRVSYEHFPSLKAERAEHILWTEEGQNGMSVKLGTRADWIKARSMLTKQGNNGITVLLSCKDWIGYQDKSFNIISDTADV